MTENEHLERIANALASLENAARQKTGNGNAKTVWTIMVAMAVLFSVVAAQLYRNMYAIDLRQDDEMKVFHRELTEVRDKQIKALEAREWMNRHMVQQLGDIDRRLKALEEKRR